MKPTRSNLIGFLCGALAIIAVTDGAYPTEWVEMVRNGTANRLHESIRRGSEKDVTKYIVQFDPPLKVGGVEVRMLRMRQPIPAFGIAGGTLAMDLYRPTISFSGTSRVGDHANYVDFNKLMTIIREPNPDLIKGAVPEMHAELFTIEMKSENNEEGGPATLFSADEKAVYIWALSMKEPQAVGGSKTRVAVERGILHVIPKN